MGHSQEISRMNKLIEEFNVNGKEKEDKIIFYEELYDKENVEIQRDKLERMDALTCELDKVKARNIHLENMIQKQKLDCDQQLKKLNADQDIRITAIMKELDQTKVNNHKLETKVRKRTNECDSFKSLL